MSDAQIAGATICIMSVVFVGAFFAPDPWGERFERATYGIALLALASLPVIGVLLLFGVK